MKRSSHHGFCFLYLSLLVEQVVYNVEILLATGHVDNGFAEAIAS